MPPTGLKGSQQESLQIAFSSQTAHEKKEDVPGVYESIYFIILYYIM